MKKKITECLLMTLFVCSLLISSMNRGQAEQYYDPTMENLVRMLFNFGKLDMSNEDVFEEFMRLNYCNVYQTYRSSEFDWKEIYNEFLVQKDKFVDKSMYIRYVIPAEFMISGYNPRYSSYTFTEDTYIDDVSVLELYRGLGTKCLLSSDRKYRYTALPTKIYLNLELPLSLYRLPVNKVVAEKYMKQMPSFESGRFRKVYANIYVQIVSSKDIESDRKNSTVDTYGFVEKILFYTDEMRRRPFKALYYNE